MNVRKRRAFIITALCALMISAAGIPAHGRIGVSPSLMLVSVTEAANSFFTTITNHNAITSIEVSVYMAGFSMTPTGMTILIATGIEREIASRIFSLYPREFILGPGETQRVEIRVDIGRAREIEPAGAAYGVVIFETRPVVEAGGMVTTISRIAAPVLVSLPVPKERSGEIAAVFAVQDRPGDRIRITTLFKNSGNVHFTPRGGTVIIRDEAGTEVARIPIRLHLGVPGLGRYMHAHWSPTELALGPHTVESIIEIEEGVETEMVTGTFFAISSEAIAQPAGRVVDFPPLIVAHNEPIQLNLLFFNSGNVPLIPEGEIEIKDEAGDLVATLSIAAVAAISPGMSGVLSVILDAGLPEGRYVAIAEVAYSLPEYGGVRMTRAQLVFTVTGEPVIIEGEIIEFAAPIVAVGRPIVPVLLVENTGNSDFTVEGLIMIKNAAGRTVGQIPIFRRTVLVGEIVDLGKPWEGDLPRGLYRLVATLILAGEKILAAEASFMVK